VKAPTWSSLDIADQLGTVPYKMATQADLDETVKLVEAYDGDRGQRDNSMIDCPNYRAISEIMVRYKEG
jgi:hypothetical protein